MHQSHPEAAGISSGLILRLPTHEPEKNGFDWGELNAMIQ